MTDDKGWRTPALILVAGCAILTLAMGVRHTAGLFLQPMSAHYGWAREVFSFAFAIQNLVWGLASPFAGGFADRFGAARTLAVSAMLYVAGLLLMSQAVSPLALNFSSGVLIGLGLSGTTYSVIMGVIGRHTTPAKRSLALGIAGAGGSFGQFAVLPVGQTLITQYGWQAALLMLGCGIAMILPLTYVLADGHRQTAGGGQSVGEALREAVGQRAFHYLFWGYFVCGFQTAFIMLHLPAYLSDFGLSANVGMTAIALIGLFNIFGSFLFGWAGGKYSKKNLLALIYAARAVAILVFMLLPLSTVSAWVFSAMIGILWLATVPLTNGVIAQVFGLRYLSMLAGIVFLGHQLGSFLGAWLGGRVFDQTGSYELAWLISIGLSVLATLCSWPIDERPLARVPAVSG